MQKCADSAFCTRLRGVRNAGYEILPKSVNVKGTVATARLQDSHSKSEFELVLSAYDGVLRVHATEPAKKRFEVPDVLIPDFVDAPLVWTGKKTTSKSLSLQLGSAALTLQYQPFKLTVTMAGKAAVELNSRSLFGVEYLREKQVCYICDRCSTCHFPFIVGLQHAPLLLHAFRTLAAAEDIISQARMRHVHCIV